MGTIITGLDYLNMSKHDIYKEYCKLYKEYKKHIDYEIKRLKTELNGARLEVFQEMMIKEIKDANSY